MSFISKIIATFFGSGFFPIAPGTAASFLTTLVYLWWIHGFAGPVQAGIIVILFFAGSLAATRYSRELDQTDPGRIVIDETCGQLIALFLCPPSWKAIAAGFILFRIFDIIKPYPINKLEKFPRGWGIMADDVGAGLAAGIVLRLILRVL
ncbi:MAG: phosphatidylglycerophosphatase A family protein [Candidatus Aminicenantales bacterium]